MDLYDGTLLTISAALKLADAHFFQANPLQKRPGTDLFCVAQAVETIPGAADGLRRRASTDVACPPGAVGGDAVGIAAPLVSHLWVADTGRTSITFGHSFATQEGRRLGAVRRVYVWVRDGWPVPLVDAEQEAAEGSREADPLPDIATLPAGGGPAASDAAYEEKVVATIGPQHCNNPGFDDSHVDHASQAKLTLQGHAACGFSYEGRNCSFHYRSPVRED